MKQVRQPESTIVAGQALSSLFRDAFIAEPLPAPHHRQSAAVQGSRPSCRSVSPGLLINLVLMIGSRALWLLQRFTLVLPDVDECKGSSWLCG
ncbi:uncharacterized protein BJX67DRAFT_363191 [Aspergillus lucknowensis]|uniref:Uncharacterized protein n=1 Tax=Aspergillus lucknowensis TaxID=176173 RepID=A0ABR4LH23_9EURO